MKNEVKILKFLYKYKKPIEVQEICDHLDLVKNEEVMMILRHLINQKLVTLYRNDGRMGDLCLEVDPVAITTNGIRRLENRIPTFVKSYVPILISLAALAVAIAAFVVSMRSL